MEVGTVVIVCVSRSVTVQRSETACWLPPKLALSYVKQQKEAFNLVDFR